MLTFKHSIAASAIHGQGLFTDEDLAQDSVLWIFVPGFDITLTEEQHRTLPQRAKDYIAYYGWLDKADGLYHLSPDGDKYTNCSMTPNTYMDAEGNIRARVFLPKGTEIVSDYSAFDNMTDYKLGK
jgi:hypothetical protein